MKLGVETYTVRKLLNIQFAQTLEDLKAMGIHTVELCKIKMNQEHLSIIKKSGIEVISMLMKMNTLDHQFNKVVAFAKETGCKIVVVSILSFKGILFGEKALLKFSKQLNQLSNRYEKEGITLAYHHHDYEFKRVNQETKLSFILKNTYPKVKIVSDTYWAKRSNKEPHELIKSLGSRLIGLHLRDCREDQKSDCDLGSGIIDFKKVFSEASKYAVYGVLEQNTKTPYISLKNSMHHINSIQTKHPFK
jgi:sugar phosphate isomerase/epimerase